MSYKYLRPGTAPSSSVYRITLKLYRDCNAPSESLLDDTAHITIYQTATNKLVFPHSIPRDHIDVVSLSSPDPCIDSPPAICYQIGYYIFEIELDDIPKGYVVSYQRCCRLEDILNVNNSGDAGVTYTTNIPGTADVSTGPINSTPVFNTSDTVIICANNYFTYDFGATDSENDQLEFKFVEAFDGATKDWFIPDTAKAPPYKPVLYNPGFSAQFPLGRNVKLDPLTGVISGVAPELGIYVLSVAVIEKRDGKIINIHRKDLHLKISNCSTAKAKLNPEYISCNGLSFTFQNLSNSPLIKTYTWDFDTSSVIDVPSYDPNPTYEYKKEGIYVVQFITNKDKRCSDTAYATVKTFPGFKPNFKWDKRCAGVAFPFTDQTESKYNINMLNWYFEDTTKLYVAANNDPLPRYTFNTQGEYKVKLVVGSEVGCLDSLTQQVVVDNKPYLKISGDTVMCTQDIKLKLNADGDAGSWKWTGDNIVGSPTVQNPLVSPTVRTQYKVTLTQAPGCVSSASVFVDVRSIVSLHAGDDTTICLGDSILLSPISDGLSYAWSPASTIVNPTSKQTWARPTETTRYAVLAKIGKECQANDGFVVTTVPYPSANAGKDTLICFGKQMQLHASGGLQYLWYPSNTLDDKTVQDPTASPILTTDYVVGVYDNKGCPKPAYDTVRVRVIPPVKAFAGNDTSVVIGQPLQLNAQGGQLFQWTPPDFLSNDGISNPIARLNNDIKFTVKVSTPEGCFAYDEVNVKVYKTTPEIFVPTAFTPNGDGLNDNLVPIPVGIVSIEYFKVYNRYGELVFSTSSIGKGWNGVYRGREQGNESFVWQVLGKDYLGKPFYKKGQSTLIR